MGGAGRGGMGLLLMLKKTNRTGPSPEICTLRGNLAGGWVGGESESESADRGYREIGENEGRKGSK